MNIDFPSHNIADQVFPRFMARIYLHKLIIIITYSKDRTYLCNFVGYINLSQIQIQFVSSKLFLKMLVCLNMRPLPLPHYMINITVVEFLVLVG